MGIFNIISGTQFKPDMYTIIQFNETGDEFKRDTTNSTLNKLGYIPGVSTITGCGRALLGLIHIIIGIGVSILRRQMCCETIKLGAINVLRGLVEMIPVAGNIMMFAIDMIRMYKFDKMASSTIKENKDNLLLDNENIYKNQCTLYSYGKEIAKMDQTRLDSILKDKLNGKEATKYNRLEILKLEANSTDYAYLSGTDSGGEYDF